MMASFLKKDVEFSSFENRSLSSLPHPYISEIISGDWFNKLETYCLDQVVARDLLVETNSRILRMLGKRQINSITVCDSGALLQAAYDYPPAESYDPAFLDEVLIPYNSAAESYGGQLYYMNIYPRLLFFWDEFPYHGSEMRNEYYKENTRFIDACKKAEIDVIDTFDTFEEHSSEYIFFLTDHHYTYKGAYYCYKEMIDYINKTNSSKAPIEFPEWNQMSSVRPQGHFWGSLISQVGDTQYEGVDYLEYALPDDFPQNYERIESGEISDMPLIRNDDTTEYGWFMNGDYANTVIKTHRPHLPSILVIGYSFTDAIELMAVYNFNEVHSIDPRSFGGNIAEYIKKTKCDYVVVQGVVSP